MDAGTATVAAAAIAAWSTIIAGLIDVRKRVNGPLTAQFDELKSEVRDVKADVRDLRAEFRHHLGGDGR